MRYRLPAKRGAPGTREGFTLIELLVVIAIVGILAALLLPSLSGSKRRAIRIACVNHLRQLGMGLRMYSDDNAGQYPPRGSGAGVWFELSQRYYGDRRLLVCPTEPPAAGRSYLINGWNDWFKDALVDQDFQRYMAHEWPEGMKDASVPEPSDTILLGEKRRGSSHVHMDFMQGSAGNDVEEIDQNRHRAGAGNATDRGGGSNFAFVDGGVRLLPFGGSVRPANLWAVTPEWRHAPAPGSP